jgi:hypothetical protein
VDCPATAVLSCDGANPAVGEITIDVDPEYCYAFLAQVQGGEPSFRHVEVSTSPGPAPGGDPHR